MVVSEVLDTVRDAMRRWEGHKESDLIVVHRIMDRSWFVGYNIGGDREWCGNFIDRDTFYLMKLRIDVGLRGKGLGSSLYLAIEDVARSVGCKEIRQTPAGWTFNGDTRESYLRRRGWSIGRGGEAFKNLKKTRPVLHGAVPVELQG